MTFLLILQTKSKKRGLTFFEINSDLTDLGYMAKYLVREEDHDIEENEIINYLKMNYIDDEIEAIINNFVTKYSFTNKKFVLKKKKIRKEM